MHASLRVVVVIVCVFLSLPDIAEPQQSFPCLEPETARRFQNEIMPELKRLTESLGIYQGLQKNERIEDVLSFAYEIAVTTLNQPLGTWNEEIKSQTVFETYVLCPIKSAGSLFALPEKVADHVREMATIRPRVVKGAYYRVMVRLSIKRSIFALTPKSITASKKLPPVSETFDLDVLKSLKPFEP